MHSNRDLWNIFHLSWDFSLDGLWMADEGRHDYWCILPSNSHDHLSFWSTFFSFNLMDDRTIGRSDDTAYRYGCCCLAAQIFILWRLQIRTLSWHFGLKNVGSLPRISRVFLCLIVFKELLVGHPETTTESCNWRKLQVAEVASGLNCKRLSDRCGRPIWLKPNILGIIGVIVYLQNLHFINWSLNAWAPLILGKQFPIYWWTRLFFRVAIATQLHPNNN